eukprot:5976580-Prymnesium_polylepis.1
MLDGSHAASGWAAAASVGCSTIRSGMSSAISAAATISGHTWRLGGEKKATRIDSKPAALASLKQTTSSLMTAARSLGSSHAPLQR